MWGTTLEGCGLCQPHNDDDDNDSYLIYLDLRDLFDNVPSMAQLCRLIKITLRRFHELPANKLCGWQKPVHCSALRVTLRFKRSHLHAGRKYQTVFEARRGLARIRRTGCLLLVACCHLGLPARLTCWAPVATGTECQIHTNLRLRQSRVHDCICFCLVCHSSWWYSLPLTGMIEKKKTWFEA